MTNTVYIATSLDGYIAGSQGELDWLETIPKPDNDDLGFAEFMDRIDVIVMGRVTFETVVSFGSGWPYPKPGIVLSSSLDAVPDSFTERVRLAKGPPANIMALVSQLGFEHVYVDGGKTIQGFLARDLIDELIITEIPVLLGGGETLFGHLEERLHFELVATQVLLGQLVKRHYRRVR